MTFEVPAEGYDRFMGRYSTKLAPQLADFGEVRAGQRVLDVGCGPGALTAELVRRLGEAAVSAVDPSESFVAAARDRFPGVDVQLAAAERIPFGDSVFDSALAQLVVHFMADPVAGLREMRRVTCRGRGRRRLRVGPRRGSARRSPSSGRQPASSIPTYHDESGLAGAREGHLGELLEEAGLTSIRATTVEASAGSRASTNGGSRSPSVSARPVPMRGRSTNRSADSCANAAGSYCRKRRSR